MAHLAGGTSQKGQHGAVHYAPPFAARVGSAVVCAGARAAARVLFVMGARTRVDRPLQFVVYLIWRRIGSSAVGKTQTRSGKRTTKRTGTRYMNWAVAQSLRKQQPKLVRRSLMTVRHIFLVCSIITSLNMYLPIFLKFYCIVVIN